MCIRDRSQGGEVAASAPAPQPDPPAAPSKKKTLFDLFSGSDGSAESPAQVAAPQQETQVAAVQPKAEPAPAPAPAPKPSPAPQAKPAGGSGYVVQLASFTSEAEAQSEYSRIKSQHPDAVGGLPQRIAQTKVGGSNRYQLGLGPVKSRAEATQVCSALFQAGERDCLVRPQ